MTIYGSVEDIVSDVVAVWQEQRLMPVAPGIEPRHRDRRSTERQPDVLDEISPPEYVHALTGIEVPHHGTISCPLPGHGDRTPSFKVYPGHEQGWYCFGCGAGGDIYNFAGALWGMDTRGPAFLDLRRRLAQELLRAAG